MSTQTNPGTALAPALWPSSVHPLTRNVVLMAIGIGILTLSAKVQVYIGAVPMTMTTFAVLLIAASYGSRLGVATIVAYIAAGLAGAPVFAGAVAGPAYLVGPTAGFIWGYIPAALIVGLAADRGWDRSIPKLALAALVGDAILFALGFVWLAWFAQLSNGNTGTSASYAWANGVEPFIVVDLVKIAVVALLVPAGWTLLKRDAGRP